MLDCLTHVLSTPLWHRLCQPHLCHLRVNCVICVNRVNRTTINNIDSRPTRSFFHVCTLPLLARLTSCSTYGLLRQKAPLCDVAKQEKEVERGTQVVRVMYFLSSKFYISFPFNQI